MLRRPIIAATLLGLILAACSTGPASNPSATGGVRQIQVTMSDQLRFEPNAFSIHAGQTVDFVVRNAGAIRHEFFLGGEPAQQDHEMEMRQMGGMQHDEENGIAVDPGQTKTLRHTFTSSGSLLAGCHETGHYAGRMKAPVTVD